MQTQIEAFIFKGTSFDYDNRTVIKLYGQSNQGSFLVTINQFQNYFFVESKQPTSFKSLDGYWVEKVVCNTQEDLKNKCQNFVSQGLRTFESDIKALERYLMDNNIFAQINISGNGVMKDGLLTFENPKITPGNYYPDYKIMSFDIETGKDGRLLSLAYSFRSKALNEDHTVVLGQGIDTPDVKFSMKEQGLLDFFQSAVKRLDPDIFTGWNVIGFDFHFLDRKSKELKFPIALGRNNRALDMFQSARGEWHVRLEGRVVIDGPWAMKMNFFSFESFKLNHVAKELLGSGKDIDEDESFDKWGEIERRFREDKMALARYNVMDATLVLDIFEKTKLIDLLLTRSFISGMLIERVGGSTASFDHFYLPSLHEAGVVAPNVEDIGWVRQAKGGFVLNPKVGIHPNVLVMDFKSLYPTVIQTFLIDPLSRLQRDVNPLTTPVGIKFSRTNHILPGKIAELLDRRSEAKKLKNTNLSQAVKILMNSFYGVMGSSGCRFYQEDLPDGITGSGQWILKTVIEYLEQRGFAVLYGDTDSLFVQLPTIEDYDGQAKILVNEVNIFLTDKLKTDFDVESKLEIQYDKFFQTLILTSARGNEEGAKKRYAGLAIKNVDGKKVEEMVLTGMEYVRSDWSLLARNFQYELIRRVFYGEDVQEYIDETLKKLEKKELDDQLVLSKRLSKPLDEYIKNVPPHARAAKLLYDQLGILKKRPQYVMTLRGAIPIELPHADVDYDYYLDRQLAPIADSILGLFGKSFEEMRGPQLSLF
ncbi:DNA polymerase II [Bacteriovorax sp. PP10]|uniref:DNA polymerase n=1 Tax=Bacteriovorax antarcticus TaxID=3088717 RepID=A0ABU5VVS8_9BACT|nr:DNA polymerase II [Bacteriovorax sp. PP10]MEA9357057.1 DNA polymerase II [Bacteriovorax sp. PP10]